jgi:hypothetical protein
MLGVVKEANVFADNIKALVDERNAHKERAEWALVQLEAANRQLQHIAGERNNWRGLALRMVRASGKLSATLTAVESLFHNSRNTILEVQHLEDQLPKPEPSNGEDAIDLDGALHDQAPEPTREEIEELRVTLASLHK